MAAKAIFVSPGGGGVPQWQRAESAGGKREASPALGGARAPAVPAVSPKPAATRRRRLHRRHLRPNQRLWENVPTVCRPWQTTAKGQTLPGYSRTWRNRFPLRRGTQRPNQFLLSLLGHTTCSYGHRPKWRCPAAASRMPQGRSARARQGALGGALEGGRARRRGLTSLCCDPN